MIERIIESELSDKESFENGVYLIENALEDFEGDFEIPGAYKKIKVIDLIKVLEDLPDEDDLIVGLEPDQYSALVEGVNALISALDDDSFYEEQLDCFCNDMTINQFLYALSWHIGQAC